MEYKLLKTSTNTDHVDGTVVISFSGGQDSVTLLGWALKKFDRVVAVSFKYGQKHEVELIQAKKITSDLNVEHHIIDMGVFGELVDSALTSNGNVNESHARLSHLPASFVPNRNQVFITMIHSFAQKIGATHLAVGTNATDYSGYPDCRPKFLEKLMEATNMGSETELDLYAPLMNISKAETFALSESVGILETVINDSHSCYNGIRNDIPGGKGCGECPACKLRIKGYNEYIQQCN